MKLVEIIYQKSETVQLKDYTPANVLFSIRAEVSKNENIHNAFEVLKSQVDDEVKIAVAILEKQAAVIREAAKIISERHFKRQEKLAESIK